MSSFFSADVVMHFSSPKMSYQVFIGEIEKCVDQKAGIARAKDIARLKGWPVKNITDVEIVHGRKVVNLGDISAG